MFMKMFCSFAFCNNNMLTELSEILFLRKIFSKMMSAFLIFLSFVFTILHVILHGAPHFDSILHDAQFYSRHIDIVHIFTAFLGILVLIHITTFFAIYYCICNAHFCLICVCFTQDVTHA